MDFNNIKGEAQQIKAPPIRRAAQDQGTPSLDDLVAQLRAADDRTRGGMRKALPLAAIATTCFLLVFAVMIWLPPQAGPASRVLLWGSLAGIYLLLTIGFLRHLRRLAEIDYTAPTRQFLAIAEQRYRFMRPKDYLVSAVGCLFLGIVAGIYVVQLMTDRYFGPEHRTLIMILYGVFYIGLCAMGFTFSYHDWRRDKRPLWLEIRRMLATFDENEPSPAQESAAPEPPR